MTLMETNQEVPDFLQPYKPEETDVSKFKFDYDTDEEPAGESDDWGAGGDSGAANGDSSAADGGWGAPANKSNSGGDDAWGTSTNVTGGGVNNGLDAPGASGDADW